MPASPKLAAHDVDAIAQLGHGTYGEVWKGKWRRPGGAIFVGIKKLHVIGLTEGQRNTIIRDVEVLATINNPYILQIYGAVAVGMEVWVVTEFIEGRSLYELLHSEELIVWAVRLRLAYQAACSVHALHSNQPSILHRDIKSSNFWVSNDCFTLKMLDFGLSKIVTVISAVPRALETPRWGAPETLEYPPKWSPEADIYSLGFTFYEIAARKIPFDETDDARFKFIAQSPERPNLPRDCPEAFANVIHMCWDPVPQRRPNSHQVLEILTTLERSALTFSSALSIKKGSPPHSLHSSYDSDISPESSGVIPVEPGNIEDRSEGKLKGKSEKQISKQGNTEEPAKTQRKGSIPFFQLFKVGKNSTENKPVQYGFVIPTLGRSFKHTVLGKSAKIHPHNSVEAPAFNLSPRTQVSLHQNSSMEFRNQSWAINSTAMELPIGQETAIFSSLKQLMMLKIADWEEGVSMVKYTLRQFFLIPATAKNSFTLKFIGEGIARTEFDPDSGRLIMYDTVERKAITYHRPLLYDDGKSYDATVNWLEDSSEFVVLLKDDTKHPIALVFHISKESNENNDSPKHDKKGKGIWREFSKKHVEKKVSV